MLQRNVFYSCEKGQKVYQEGFSRGGRPAPRLRNTKADYNLYYSTVDPQWGKRHILEQQKYGVEEHSISADPMFVNINKGNFRLKQGSPALALDINQPVSIDEVGLQATYRERWNRK